MGDFPLLGVMGGQQIASVGKIINVEMQYLQFPAAAANAVILIFTTLMIIFRNDAYYRCPKGALNVQRSFQVHDDKFLLFVYRFLYGPMFCMLVPLFPGTRRRPDISDAWFFSILVESLFDGVGVIDIWSAFGRSLRLGLVVIVLTVIFSLMAGLAFRKKNSCFLARSFTRRYLA